MVAPVAGAEVSPRCGSTRGRPRLASCHGRNNCGSGLSWARCRWHGPCWLPRRTTMEEHFVWMTTRQIKPGTLADFERASGAEARRRAAMAAYVLGEQEAFYRGRELHVPDH